MKKQHIYDPEDLESLMINKSFDELLEAERVFALRHVDGEHAYTAMRSTLLTVLAQANATHPNITPPSAQRKSALLDAYRAKHTATKRPLFSLNGLAVFFSNLRENRSYPVFAFTIIVLLVVGVWWVASDDLAPAQRMAQMSNRETLQESAMPENAGTTEGPVREDLTAPLEENASALNKDNESPAALETEDFEANYEDADLAEDIQVPAADLYIGAADKESRAKAEPSASASEPLSTESTSRATSLNFSSNSAAEMDNVGSSLSVIVMPAERLMSVNTMRAVLGEMTSAE